MQINLEEFYVLGVRRNFDYHKIIGSRRLNCAVAARMQYQGKFAVEAQ